MIYFILGYFIPLVILHIMLFLSSRKYLNSREDYEKRAIYFVSFLPILNIGAFCLYLIDEFVSNFSHNYFKWLTKK